MTFLVTLRGPCQPRLAGPEPLSVAEAWPHALGSLLQESPAMKGG